MVRAYDPLPVFQSCRMVFCILGKGVVRIFKTKKCPNCLGRGICKDGSLCPTCRGEGEVSSSLDVVVPEVPCWDVR